MRNLLFGIILCFSQGVYAQTAPVSPQVEAETPVSSPGAGNSPEKTSEWSNHFQSTTITQTHSSFHSPYSGPLSLSNHFEIPTSVTATLFIGHKLWKDAYIFANPEESMGAGLSSTHGIAAFPNGEIYRVDDANPKTNLSRFFIQQDLELGGEREKTEDDLNQFEVMKSTDRITFILGKFSLNDYFDNNTYSHDPRTQFFNWALMDTAAWDYAADTRGYTWGVYTELHLTKWSFRFAVVQVPAVANGLTLEGDLRNAHAENAEVEYRYQLEAHPGKIRFLMYSNQARMGDYRTAIASAAGHAPDVTQTRSFSTKNGLALNFEQEINPDLGVFSRIGWSDGNTETWAFTEADRSFSLGASLKGNAWKRNQDTLGLACIVDGLSGAHQDYLKAGGLGFIIGEGALNYSPEEVLETFYSYQVRKPLSLTLDFQAVNHPGYNADRGPVAIYGLRVHYEI